MSNWRRDLSSPITVINRFTVRIEPEDFEREFRRYSQYLRRLKDFEFLVTLQLVERPNIYVHLAHWGSLQGFLNVVHDDSYLAHIKLLGEMVEAEADQGVSVRRLALRSAQVGAQDVMLLHARAVGDRRKLEESFAALSKECIATPGFGGSDLLRSTIRPLFYLALLWWSDAEMCDLALHKDGVQERLTALSDVSGVFLERARHVAHERGTDC